MDFDSDKIKSWLTQNEGDTVRFSIQCRTTIKCINLDFFNETAVSYSYKITDSSRTQKNLQIQNLRQETTLEMGDFLHRCLSVVAVEADSVDWH